MLFRSRLAFLAIKSLPQESSPVHRGKVVSTRLLCNTILPPPPELMANPPPIGDNVQTREAYESHTTNPACAACHKVLDPFGFAFESFDPIGRYRDKEAGRPVNTAGSVFIDNKNVGYKGVADFMATLSKSAQVQACVANQALRFSLGREVGASDQASIVAVNKAFSVGGDLRELAVAIARSETFRNRLPAPQEVTE